MPPTPADPQAATRDPLVGKVVADKYRVLDLVARGGMGRIYRAEQLPLGREVALKILTRPMLGSAADDAALEKRFLLEAATCARLAHPNTVSVYDYGSIHVDGDHTFYIVMELIRGRTLAQALRAEGPMSPPRVARIGYEIARSLREAHLAGVVHRDLKPSNVMLVQTDEGESVKVLDFGVAKVLAQEAESLTTDGSFVGSPRYTAPEQIRQQGVDGRSDLYALGIVLWELLTGAAPFSSNEPMRTLLMQLNDPLPPFSPRHVVPPGFEALVRRLLEKDPAARLPDADTLIAALRPFRGGEPGDSTMEVPLPQDAVTHPTSSGTLPPAAPARRGWFLAAFGFSGALVFVVLIFALGGWWVLRSGGFSTAEAPGAGAADPAAVLAAGGPEAPKPEAAAVPVVVSVTSEPPGAEVWLGGTKVGTTPYPLSFADAQAGTVVVELVRPGYKRASLTVAPGAPGGVAAATLERVEGKKAAPPPPPPPGDGLRMER